MGDTIHIFDIKKLDIPVVSIDRWTDTHTKQTQIFHIDQEARLTTESGNSITLFGRTTDGATVEITIPVSIDDLIEYLIEAQRSE